MGISGEESRLQGNRSASLEINTRSKKRPRKSRSKGLRTKAGCITCRKRHKKCDERSPKCGNCAISNRDCMWPEVQSNSDDGEPVPAEVPVRFDINSSESALGRSKLSPLREEVDLSIPGFDPAHAGQIPAGSPSNTVGSDFLTADLASIRWLDLLAADAEQANRGFSRGPSPFGEDHVEDNGPITASNASNIDERGAFTAANSAIVPNIDTDPWRLDNDVVLKDFESIIFRNFTDRAALWLDVLDPLKHFSVYASRLALRNIGLMKAILALSAQHLSRQSSMMKNNPFAPVDSNLPVQYYYETLHYVQTALQYDTYAHSEEILATALVISTYEMLDESDSGWQRHLKGVFWIQRSQDVNGASGGIRQAVWWAWLRQDTWAAFRERRRCFSFWKPVKDYPELGDHELAARVIYLFSQAVNFCAEPSSISEEGKEARADELLSMLDRWKSFMGTRIKPLPTTHTNSAFQPMWIHPPEFGVALQMSFFARILIILHRPALPGFKSYLKAQKSLSEAVAVICGVAMELRDEGCQIVSSQCLYGAGLCVQDVIQRSEIISLIDSSEARTGWPMSTMKEDLYKEWKKIDSGGEDENP